ncbi:MAG: stage III sporulation protein AA [Clostridia bacterium]|nr:stage III sporulation protein AA [Clostridia bacterium]
MICTGKSKGIIGLLKYFPIRIYEALGKTPVICLEYAEEVRMGAGKPLMIFQNGICSYITSEGKITSNSSQGIWTSKEELEETLRLLCDGSVYTMEENIKNGYITLSGGHRVGICGSGVIRQGKLENLRDISYLNIRISREIIGASDEIIDCILEGGIKNTLIISPPGGGKTTMLRDICRVVGGSDRYNYKVGVADERGEIGASYRGMPQNNIGVRTCIMDGVPKAKGMEMMLRCMGIDVMITDEIGTEEDKNAIAQLLRCGVKVIASAHGNSLEDIKSREHTATLLGKGKFENIIILKEKKVEGLIRLDA